MAVKNAVTNVKTLLADFRASLDGTEYEGLLPDPVSTNIREFGGTLMNYEPVMNRFFDFLVNKVSFTKVNKMYFTNPFGFAKRGMIPYGYTIDDIWVDIATAHAYGEDTDPWAMLKTEKPDLKVAYHNRNREDYFKQTIWRRDLQAAFYSEEGVASLVDRVINGMYTSNDVAEFAYTLALFVDYIDSGKFKLVHADEPTDETTAKSFLTALRIASNTLRFPTRSMNAAGVMNTTSLEDQRLFITPKADAVTSVQALAYAFHMDEARFLGRITLIPEIPNHPEIIAVIADEEFLNIYDNLFEANDFYDREKLSWNYWLHVWQTYFLSPFHNAVAITTAALPTITSVTIAGADTYTPGGSSVYTATVTGTNNPSQAVMWSVLGNTSSSTRMNDQGVLSVGAEEKGNLTIYATPYLDNSVHGEKAVTAAGG